MITIMNKTVMRKEVDYTKSVTQQHIKSLGQYFTNPAIARFMCDWAIVFFCNMQLILALIVN